ncbi:S-layer homology domain-containing protein [Calorimonas adulescens]|uniref:Uncharacterized protein n=1 Tax=Calorimonas adulescens TaxID=2606906 RepID=A0A5D8QD84_9THEO|nr:S-layer homology domain-containing protein [Calorimonas adulescens]TZE82555.1 hypothetical protein FWJ32_04560 [Calorimonas adulescens]
MFIRLNRSNRFYASLILILAMLFSMMPFNLFASNNVQAAAADHVVISEVYGGGGISEVPYRNDFIELYNPTGEDVSLDGWSVQYASATGTSWNVTVLSGTIASHGYYLVQESGGSAGDALPTPDAAGSINMSGTKGKVALVKNTQPITGKSDEDVVDFVGYGGANDYEGSGPTSSPSNTTSVQRRANDGSDPTADGKNNGNGWDTEDNKADFVTGAPEPQNSQSPKEPSEGPNPPSNNRPSIENINFTPEKPEPNSNISIFADISDIDSDDTVEAWVYYKNDSAQEFSTVSMAVYNGTTYTAGFTVGSITSSFKIVASDGKDTTESSLINVPINRGTISILEAKSLPDNTDNVTVEGIITAKFGTSNAYIQDDTSGVLIYGANSSFDLGYRLRVTGKMTTYNGERELSFSGNGVEILQQGVQLPTPHVITLDQVKDTKIQGTLVEVQNVKVDSISGTNFYVTDSRGENRVQIYNQPKFTLPDFIAVGNYVTVYGIPAIYKDTYEIKIRVPGDLAIGAPPEDTTPPVITHTPVTEGEAGTDITINAVITDDLNIPTAKLYYRVKDSQDFTSIDMTATGTNYTAIIPGEVITTSGIEYYIEASDGKNTARKPETGAYSINITADTTGPSISNILPVEDSVIFSARPIISATVTDPSGIDESSIVFTLDENDIKPDATFKNGNLKYEPESDLNMGKHTVSLSVKDLRGNESSITWEFTIMEEGALQHFVGTTHNHTEISHDARGNPEDALKAAIAHNYDWFTFSEHSHDIDPSLRPNDSVNAPGSSTLFERKGGNDWQLEKQLSSEYTNNPEIKSGNFVVFPSFEMTSTTWGHSNVLGTENFIDRIQEGGAYQDLQKFYAWVLTHPEAVAQFNHPGMPEGSFGGFVPYQPDVDKLFSIMEVGNGSGEYSYVNTDYIYYKALDIGWHVAPTFGEDNHDATWGQTPRRTVVLADRLTPDSLLDAMKNMRVYMVEDPNLRLEVTANGYPMGSELPSDGKINFKVKVWDDVQEDDSYDWVKKTNFKTNDEIKNIELITNTGKTIESIDPAGTSYEGEFTIDSTGHNWYVIKVTQEDGQRAYSAPFWTPEVPVDLKMVGLGTSPEQCIVDTEVTLSAGLSNLGVETINNIEVAFYKNSVSDENLIGTVTVPSISPKGNATATLKYTPDVAGSITIIAKILNAPSGDNDSDNQASVVLKVNEPLGITVMIDMGHNNDYANGNLTELQDQLRQAGFTVVQNTSKFTVDSLNNIDVLIMTQPIGSVNYLTNEEMQYVSDFVKNGGGLFYTGKGSNNNDPTVSNPLLDNIGANIHINFDDIYENDSSRQYQGDKSPWAVLIQNFPREDNEINMCVDRVQNLRYFSGASLVDRNNQELTNDDGVTILAYANPTSYQTDQVGYTSDTTYKYSDPSKMPILAVQEIGNGRIAVTGRGFFSNYEYGSGSDNELLTLNLLNWLAKNDITLTPIGDFRNKPEGTYGVVRGVVTSGAGVFFDAFYLQDETGGIMAFNEVPENAELEPGDIVRVYGRRTVFENNDELTFDKYNVDVIKVGHTDPLLPKEIKTGDASKPENQGKLIKTSGYLKQWYNDTSFYIDDGSGQALVFVDGYIINQSGPLPELKVGDYLTAVGFPSGFSGGQRIRVRDTREITISAPTTVPVTGVTLDKETLDLKVGETYKLIATVEPENATDKRVTWSSSNGAVATVGEDGTVTAVSEGTATITVTTVDGDKTDSCIVTITHTSSGGGKNRDRGNDNDHNTPIADIVDSSVSISTGNEVNINLRDIMNINNDTLSIKGENVDIELPLDELKNMDEFAILHVKVSSQPLKEAEIKEDLKGYKAASDVYDINLEVVNNNESSKVNFNNHPVTVKIRYNGSGANRDLLGVYYIDDAGKFVYIGGKVVDEDSIIFKTTHFSKYVVMEYDKTFADTVNHWAQNDIKIMAARHIAMGIDEANFAPDRSITRAQFASLLVRTLKLDDDSTQARFEDVSSNAWYYSDISAAYKAGIITGIDDKHFMPNKNITREEMALMIFRAYKYATGKQLEKALAEFNDKDKISAWALEAVNNVYNLGIVNGLPQNMFGPDQIATRAQAVTMLKRLMEVADIY